MAHEPLLNKFRADAAFERPIEGTIVHRGWRLTLSGRIDPVIPAGDRLVLREIK